MMSQLEGLLVQANDLIRQYDEAISAFACGNCGDIREEDYVQYDEVRADYGEEAMELVRELASFANIHQANAWKY